MSTIRVVSASAGTGKTHHLATQLKLALTPGSAQLVSPEHVLATTFTRKAAAELAQRAREHLLTAGLWEEAFRLDAGLIGTVNGICDSLLRRFALEAGLPPEMAVFDDADVDLAFGASLAGVIDQAAIGRLEDLSRRFGLGGGGRPQTWRTELLNIVKRSRENGLAKADLLASADRSIGEMHALLSPPDPAGGAALDRRLQEAVARGVDRLRSGDDTTKTTEEYGRLLAEAQQAFRRDDIPPWPLWVKLSKAEAAKKSQGVSDAVREAAASHLAHPRLRAELEEWIRLEFRLAADSLDAYQQWKRERRLVDFVDQETLVLRLLTRPDVRERLAADIHLVLVDEFQDTSPLELAVFLAIASIARRSLWVGDPKQSIFGFRGADSRLMKAVLESIGEGHAPEVLSKSYRSRPALVHLASELFAVGFAAELPREQVVLEPHRKEVPGLPPPVHAWLLDCKNRGEVAGAIAVGISDLLGRDGGQPVQVCDRATEQLRPIRPGDIAVLCRSNDHCAGVAHALEALGVRSALARVGLLATPEATLTLACLRRLADSSDTLATAEIVTLTQDDPAPTDWLAERIEFVRSGGNNWKWKADHPTVSAIERQRQWLAVSSPAELLDRVIDAADLAVAVQSWGNGQVRLGNLDALRGLARAYEEHCSRQRHAATVPGLLAWLTDVPGTDRDKQVEGAGDDAVHVLTYYRAKGLEWPVVVLDDLVTAKTGDPWWLSVADDRARIELQAPLAGRWLRYWPWPYGAQKKGSGLAESTAGHPVAVDAGRRELAESMRLLYVGFTRPRDVLVIPMPKNGTQTLAWLDRVLVQDGERRLRWPAEPGEHQLALKGTRLKVPVRVRRFSPRAAAVTPQVPSVWAYSPRQEVARASARVAVSRLEPVPGPVRVKRTIPVGAYLPIRGTDDIAAVGNAVHAFLAADDPSFPRAMRLDMARDLQVRFRVPGAVDVEGLVHRGDEVRSALAAATAYTAWRPEWPLELRVGDRVVVGRADLVLETPAGLVIVDHKCHPGSPAERQRAAAEHVNQLAIYGRALSLSTEQPLVGVFLHFAIAGEIYDLDVPLEPQALEVACLEAVKAESDSRSLAVEDD